MIIDPDRYIKQLREAGANNRIIHLEACTHWHRTMRAYVVINSHTAVNTLEAISQDIDHLLIMTVNPGFIGQSFIDDAYRKIELNRHLIKKNSAQKTIQVDGGC